MICKKQVATFTIKFLGNSLTLWLVQRRNGPEKPPFKATINWITLAVRWPVKYIFAPNSPIFPKSLRKNWKSDAKGFLLSEKAKKTITFYWYNFNFLLVKACFLCHGEKLWQFLGVSSWIPFNSAF